jgi:hypothetical protein
MTMRFLRGWVEQGESLVPPSNAFEATPRFPRSHLFLCAASKPAQVFGRMSV